MQRHPPGGNWRIEEQFFAVFGGLLTQCSSVDAARLHVRTVLPRSRSPSGPPRGVWCCGALVCVVVCWGGGGGGPCRRETVIAHHHREQRRRKWRMATSGGDWGGVGSNGDGPPTRLSFFFTQHSRPPRHSSGAPSDSVPGAQSTGPTQGTTSQLHGRVSATCRGRSTGTPDDVR